MGKGNIFMGNAKNKVGSIVFYQKGSDQVYRKWTDAGARKGKEASYAARAQRVRFGAAAAAWRAFRYVCTRMYNVGKKPEQSDYNYFTYLNWRYLPYLTKTYNEIGFTCCVPGMYSRGNLGQLNLYLKATFEADREQTTVTVDSYDVQTSDAIQVTDKVSKLKSVLKLAFPNADKISYLYMFQKDTNVAVGNANYRIPQIRVQNFVIDLINETVEGEDDDTVLNLITRQVESGTPLYNLITRQQYLFEKTALATLSYQADEIGAGEYEILPLIFATNTRANDCYTTTVFPGAFPTNIGPFRWWALNRTASAFNRAASSYGYTSNVMQTDIADTGVAVVSYMQLYIDRLKMTDKTTAAAMQAALDANGEDAAVIPITEIMKTYGAPKASPRTRSARTGSSAADGDNDAG